MATILSPPASPLATPGNGWEGSGLKRKAEESTEWQERREDGLEKRVRREIRVKASRRERKGIGKEDSMMIARRQRMLCCTDGRMEAFRIGFVRMEGKEMAELQGSVSEEDKESAENVCCGGGEVPPAAMASLLASRRVYRRLWEKTNDVKLRSGVHRLKSETDGVFVGSRTGAVLACVNRGTLRKRRKEFVEGTMVMVKVRSMAGSRHEKMEEVRVRETALLEPGKEEEDAQIAGIMASLGQETWLGGTRECLGVDGQRFRGLWVHLAAINPGVGVNLYRGLFSQDALRFQRRGSTRVREEEDEDVLRRKTSVSIEYCTVEFNGDHGTFVRRLHGWLHECQFF